jgi:hypothetical protein
MGAEIRCIPSAAEAANGRNAEQPGIHPMGGTTPKEANPFRHAIGGYLISHSIEPAA